MKEMGMKLWQKLFKRSSYEDAVFLGVIYLILTMLALIAAYPFVHVLARSFSSYSANLLGQVTIFPVQFRLDAYVFIFQGPSLLRSFLVSITITAIGTLLTVFLVSITAYPLSYPRLRWKKPLMIFFILPLFWDAGFIPNYLLVRNLGLLNTIWSVILPLLLPTFIILIAKNYYEGLPPSLIESAEIDGASEWNILWRIVIPLSGPVTATITVYTIVGYWNNFVLPLLYISDNTKQPLPLYLYRIIERSRFNVEDLTQAEALAVYSATIIVSIPIVLLYPFIQKYYIKGMTLGAIKG